MWKQIEGSLIDRVGRPTTVVLHAVGGLFLLWCGLSLALAGLEVLGPSSRTRIHVMLAILISIAVTITGAGVFFLLRAFRISRAGREPQPLAIAVPPPPLAKPADPDAPPVVMPTAPTPEPPPLVIGPVAKVFLHIVLVTANYEPDLEEPSNRTRLFDSLGQVANELGSDSLAVGGGIDHAHLLVDMPVTKNPTGFVEELKAASTRWIIDNLGGPFAWQPGFAAFSVGPADARDLIDHIDRQEEVHRATSFPAEFRELCEQHGVFN